MIAFIDTESDPISKKPSSIQIRYDGLTYLFTDFTNSEFIAIREIWNKAEAIVFFNAVYDMGVLSICFSNEYKWQIDKVDNETSSYWKLRLFDNDYKVRRISSHRNYIKGMNKYFNRENSQLVGFKNPQPKFNKKIPHTTSTPVIDLLKLWSILIDDGAKHSIGLKAIVEREFGYKMLPWSPDNALNERYMSDDVEYLEKLWDVFTDKIKSISELSEFTLEDFSKINTPATFTKILYSREYIELKEMQDKNDKVTEKYNLKTPLETAYHGGITLAFYRGTIKNVIWVDIKGAYAKAIEILKTDNYIQFDFQKVSSFDMNSPFLMEIKGNFVMKTVNKSLKLYYSKEIIRTWIWNYDIDAIRHMIDDYEYEILEIYKPIPLLNNPLLTVEWQNMKNSLDKKDPDERVLREFYKFLGNTSYGIKAQRKPFRTIHTNMVIAGIITSKVHQILCKIMYEGRINGLDNEYNDTDSAAFHFKEFPGGIIEKINKRISPFEVESEGVFLDNTFLSLKRYISTNDISEKYGWGHESDKVKIHGKGRYQVSRAEMLDFINTQTVTDEDECLIYGNMSGNTEMTFNMIMNLDGMKELITHPHPFMFVTNVVTDKTRLEFFESWYDHIDTKLSYSNSKKNHSRCFRRFNNDIEAQVFYGEKLTDSTETINMDYRQWDKEILEDFQI